MLGPIPEFHPRKTGFSARALGQGCLGDPQNFCTLNNLGRKVIFLQGGVGGGDSSIKHDGGGFGGSEGGKSQWRLRTLLRGDVCGVNAPVGHPLAHIVTKSVCANFCGQHDAVAKSCCSDCDVAGASTDRLVKTLLSLKSHVRLPGVKIDADAPDTQDVHGAHDAGFSVGATVLVRYSKEVVIWWMGPSPSAGMPSVMAVSCSMTYQPW